MISVICLKSVGRRLFTAVFVTLVCQSNPPTQYDNLSYGYVLHFCSGLQSLEILVDNVTVAPFLGFSRSAEVLSHG